jgi:hypothetical protein
VRIPLLMSQDDINIVVNTTHEGFDQLNDDLCLAQAVHMWYALEKMGMLNVGHECARDTSNKHSQRCRLCSMKRELGI